MNLLLLTTPVLYPAQEVTFSFGSFWHKLNPEAQQHLCRAPVRFVEEEQMNNVVLKVHIWFRTILICEEGQDLIEYALLLSLVAFGAVTGMESLAGGLDRAFDHLSILLFRYVSGAPIDN